MTFTIEDKTYSVFNQAFSVLEQMSKRNKLNVSVNRSYVNDETISLNFRVKGKRYLLVLFVNTGECQIWHSRNKFNTLQKNPYTVQEVMSGKFLIN